MHRQLIQQSLKDTSHSRCLKFWSCLFVFASRSTFVPGLSRWELSLWEVVPLCAQPMTCFLIIPALGQWQKQMIKIDYGEDGSELSRACLFVALSTKAEGNV